MIEAVNRPNSDLRDSVCVCVREREREAKRGSLRERDKKSEKE